MEDDDRMCWICHLTDEDQPALKWVSPCRCSGSTRWVHQRCLLRWINDSDVTCGADRKKCPNGCGVRYTIAEGAPSVIVQLGDLVNECVERSLPLISLTAGLTTLWAGLACYSALTIVTVSGHMGVRALARTDPGVAYLTLPLLPLGLIACRAVSATDLIGPRPSVNGGNGGGAVGDTEEEEDDYEDEWVIGSRPFSFSRVAVGALLFPYTAYGTGWLCFGRVRDSECLLRTAFGGLLFLFGKSLTKKIYLFHKQQQLTSRRVLNFEAVGYLQDNR
eukprot:m.137925 g.137925  ORF g.137925 m.137925 type:complete len:276 (-) comp13987_c0_seq4:5384-6211(-)